MKIAFLILAALLLAAPVGGLIAGLSVTPAQANPCDPNLQRC